MTDALEKVQATATLRALERLMAAGTWQESNFLKVIGRKLHEIHKGLVQEINELEPDQTKTMAHLANRVAARLGKQEVFVGLYSLDGYNISVWERLLANLPKNMVSRPVYAAEEQIKAMIVTKEKKENEAYISIYIGKQDILNVGMEKPAHDKLGQPLLTLKDNAIQVDRMNIFCHLSRKYTYSAGRLTLCT